MKFWIGSGCVLATVLLGLLVRLRVNMLLLSLFVGLVNVAYEVQAQDRVLVSNIGKASTKAGSPDSFFPGTTGSNVVSSLFGLTDHAQKFTTGDNKGGYKLNSVDIQFGRITTGPTYTAKIQNASGNLLGNVVGTLITPGFSTSTDDQTLTFTAPPSGITLGAGKKYFLVLDVSGTQDQQRTDWRTTLDNDEDSSGLKDWKIEDTHIFKAGKKTRFTNITGQWQANIIPSSLKFRLRGEVIKSPGVTVSVTDSIATEGSSTDEATFTVVLDSRPTNSVDIILSPEPGLETRARVNSMDFNSSRTLRFTRQNWKTPQTVKVRATENNADSPRGRELNVTYRTASGDRGYHRLRGTAATVRVIDNDPTIVTLKRVGTGDIAEGETTEFQVRLSRALVAGEIIDVPLMISGTDVTKDDWTLRLKRGASLNMGVRLTGQSTETPKVRFSGAGARMAILVLKAKKDEVSESDETITVALGPDGTGMNGFDHNGLGTNVGGGANPASAAADNSFDVVVSSVVPPGVIISVTDSIATEGSMIDKAAFKVVLNSQPTRSVFIFLKRDPELETAPRNILRFTRQNWKTPQTVEVRATENDVDNPRGRKLNITYATTSRDRRYHRLRGTAAIVRVIDNDPTAVTLAGTNADIQEGEAKDITLKLSRGLVNGEVLDLPLTFAGTAVRGKDYITTCPMTLPKGVVCNDLNESEIPTVTFTGPMIGKTASEVTLTVTARRDSETEVTAETVNIGLADLDANSGIGLGGGAAGTDKLGTFSITNAPSFAIADASATEGDAIT
ncbi:MAG: hypothetical protein OXC62_13415, partial [Aestuariivita sp.]|nr:hypothetical protein [Aestuariivita sp.]